MIVFILGLLVQPLKAASLPPLDVSSATSDQPLLLTGPWELYRCQLITPQSTLPTLSVSARTGQSWNVTELDTCGGLMGTQGFGTYRLRIKGLKPGIETYQFALKLASSSFHMFVYPEQHPEVFKEARSGKVAQEAATMVPAYQSRILSIQPLDTEEIWVILIQIANYQHARGGLIQPPMLGQGQFLAKEMAREIENAIVCIGFISFMMIYSLMLYFRRPEDKASLLLSLTCLMAICRLIPTANLLYHYVEDPSVWLFKLHFYLEYTSLVCGSTFYMLFTYYSFKSLSRPKWVKPLAIVGALCGLICLTTPIWFFTRILSLFQLLLAMQSLLAFVTILKAVRLKREGAWLVLVGDITLISCAIYDFLMVSGIFPRTIYITQYGACAFLFMQSQLVVRRFVKAFRTAERLQRELQSEVERQTEDISSMMQNIPQGVFVIKADLTIQQHYSRFLETILGATELNGRPALETLFAASSLSKEQIDMVYSTLVASLSEDRLVWEMNAGNLPQEMTRGIDASLQFLDLDWNPIVNRADRVDRILVTVRDVTQLKSLQELAQRNQSEFEMILEMIQSDRESIVSFFEQGAGLLSDMENSDSGRQVLIKLHTFKGLARSYGLRRLTTQIHDIERSLIPEQSENWVNWSKQKSQTALHSIDSIFNDYRRLMIDKLKWLGPSSNGNGVTREELLDLEKRVEVLMRRGVAEPSIMVLIGSVQRILENHLWLNVSDLLQSFRKDLRSLADELDKPEPQLIVRCPSLSLSTTMENLLRQALLHLLRNSLDHGIESRAERVKSGKDERGQIHIEIAVNQVDVEVYFYDDGRGLNLEVIRKIGLERGLFSSDRSLSSEEIAHLIFVPGFSTKGVVSTISGRGVGMDAVREAFVQADGTLAIELLSLRPDAQGYRPFRIVGHLPLKNFLPALAS